MKKQKGGINQKMKKQGINLIGKGNEQEQEDGAEEKDDRQALKHVDLLFSSLIRQNMKRVYLQSNKDKQEDQKEQKTSSSSSSSSNENRTVSIQHTLRSFCLTFIRSFLMFLFNDQLLDEEKDRSELPSRVLGVDQEQKQQSSQQYNSSSSQLSSDNGIVITNNLAIWRFQNLLQNTSSSTLLGAILETLIKLREEKEEELKQSDQSQQQLINNNEIRHLLKLENIWISTLVEAAVLNPPSSDKQNDEK
ncbi:MAG: hypothetical protein EZS28_053395, partial [Streblomastix strix]